VCFRDSLCFFFHLSVLSAITGPIWF
jgi:hypothetical protein